MHKEPVNKTGAGGEVSNAQQDWLDGLPHAVDQPDDVTERLYDNSSVRSTVHSYVIDKLPRSLPADDSGAFFDFKYASFPAQIGHISLPIYDTSLLPASSTLKSNSDTCSSSETRAEIPVIEGFGIVRTIDAKLDCWTRRIRRFGKFSLRGRRKVEVDANDQAQQALEEFEYGLTDEERIMIEESMDVNNYNEEITKTEKREYLSGGVIRPVTSALLWVRGSKKDAAAAS